MSAILIGNLARWTVTMLFGISIAAYVYILVAQHVAQHRRWTGVVVQLLHITMSAAMILMAWRVGLTLPTVAAMIFFVLAAVWFGGMATRTSCATRDRLTNGYNALTMAAMAWMYLLMGGSLPGRTGHWHDHAVSESPAMKMPELAMSTPEASSIAPVPRWITGVNWIATLGFALMALYWVYRYLATRRPKPVPHAAQLAHWEMLGQLFTAAGTALMFGAMLYGSSKTVGMSVIISGS